MVSLRENFNLKPFNTFGITAHAKYFCFLTSLEQFHQLTQLDLFHNEKKLILGGGSNLLFTKDFNGLVIHNGIDGIKTVNETDDAITLQVNAGMSWHALVLHCVTHNFGGVENLSLIPGTVGAAPIQNIGAYGVEVSEVIETIDAMKMSNGERMSFTNDECRFGYRESIFKHEWKEKIFISSVTLRLTKKNHLLNITYSALNDTLKKMNTSPTIQSVSDAVIQIRKEKLPDYHTLGNAGSFFKNPEITISQFNELKNTFPVMPSYLGTNQRVKIPAGWLIEQCGWKEKKNNRVGVHAQQALVLVNYGDASGKEIFDFAIKIIESIKEKFSITLTPEVNIL